MASGMNSINRECFTANKQISLSGLIMLDKSVCAGTRIKRSLLDGA